MGTHDRKGTDPPSCQKMHYIKLSLKSANFVNQQILFDKLRKDCTFNLLLRYVNYSDYLCLGCHPEHKGWEVTAHATTIRTPNTETVVAPFTGDIITTGDGKVKFKPFVENNAYKVTLYDLTNEPISVTYTIARTHGGVALVGKQRYQARF